jgi:Signal transduction histidine kinase
MMSSSQFKEGAIERMKRLSIRFKILTLTMFILIPLSILQIINIKNNFSRSIEQKLQASEELANAVSKSFSNYIEEVWGVENIIGKKVVIEGIDDVDTQSYFEQLLNDNETTLQRVSLVSPDGIIVASTNKDRIGSFVGEEEYFKKIRDGEENVLSNLIIDNDDTMVFPVARSIKKDGKILGILVSIVDAKKLISRIPNLNLNKSDILVLVDNNGRIVYSSNNTNMSFQERELSKNAPFWQTLNGEVIRTYKLKSKFDGENRMGLDYPIKEFGWDVSITSLRKVVLHDIYKQTENSIIVLILTAIISFLTASFYSKKIVKPILLLTEKANEMKNGNYDVRTNITGNDEIACTAEAFDQMANSIQEYDMMKSQFFSNMSHELKTPVNVIYSSIQLIDTLRNSTTPENFILKTSNYMSGIKQNCFRLMKLIDNIIDVDKCENGHLKMTPCRMDIIAVVENICMSVVKFAEQKGINIIFDTDIEEKETFSDPHIMERIMLNLISNALKFTDEKGFIFINVYDNKDSIKISVRDTGIGIPEDKINLIFDRFKQVDTSLNRNHEGSGLGLSVVKALIEANKGNISVDSEVGKGTEFIIEFPIVTPPSEYDNKVQLFEGESNTIKKINIEFSDIYSINFDK